MAVVCPVDCSKMKEETNLRAATFATPSRSDNSASALNHLTVGISAVFINDPGDRASAGSSVQQGDRAVNSDNNTGLLQVAEVTSSGDRNNGNSPVEHGNYQHSHDASQRLIETNVNKHVDVVAIGRNNAVEIPIHQPNRFDLNVNGVANMNSAIGLPHGFPPHGYPFPYVQLPVPPQPGFVPNGPSNRDNLPHSAAGPMYANVQNEQNNENHSIHYQPNQAPTYQNQFQGPTFIFTSPPNFNSMMPPPNIAPLLQMAQMNAQSQSNYALNPEESKPSPKKIIAEGYHSEAEKNIGITAEPIIVPEVIPKPEGSDQQNHLYTVNIPSAPSMFNGIQNLHIDMAHPPPLMGHPGHVAHPYGQVPSSQPQLPQNLANIPPQLPPLPMLPQNYPSLHLPHGKIDSRFANFANAIQYPSYSFNLDPGSPLNNIPLQPNFLPQMNLTHQPYLPRHFHCNGTQATQPWRNNSVPQQHQPQRLIGGNNRQRQSLPHSHPSGRSHPLAKPAARVEEDGQIIKTALCRNLLKHGYCEFGEGCHFAHNSSELQTKQPNQLYKTIPCSAHASGQVCPYAEKCHYYHEDEDDLLRPKPFFRPNQADFYRKKEVSRSTEP